MRSRSDLAAVERGYVLLDAKRAQSTNGAVNSFGADALDGPAWPKPQTLGIEFAPQPYPLDALPETVRAAVEEVTAFVQAPVALVATCALSALSAAIQSRVDVERASRLSGPCSLFTLAVADSGERKTTVDGFFTQSLHDYDRRQADAAKPAVAQHAAEYSAWEAKRNGLLDAIRQASKKGEAVEADEHALSELEKKKPTSVRVPRLVLGDETPEHLAYRLAKEWPAGAVMSSEAGTVLGAHGMGRDSVMRNLALLNTLWDGGTLSIGRRTSESFVVSGARLTVGLQIQASAFRAFFDESKGLARGTGFLARFLIAWPTSTQGTRSFKEPPAHWPHLARFNSRLADILDQSISLDESGGLVLQMLTLSPGAKAGWIEFHDAIEHDLKPEGELVDVRDVAAKVGDNAARIAALFELFERGDNAVSVDSMQRGTRIAAWHLSEARRFFGEIALPPAMANAARLSEWLVKYCRAQCTAIVPTKAALQRGPNNVRNKAALDLALAELSDSDHVRAHDEGRKRSIVVNPQLLDGGTA